ncbi:hypothetical protein Tco_1313429 [Tanacetum coccineum]
MKCPQHYLTEIQEVILFYNGLDIPTRQILDSKGDIPTKIASDAKVAIQEMTEYSQKWHNGTSRTRSTETSDGLAAIQAQLNNLGREIKKVNEKVYAAQVGCEQCKGPHYTKDCPLKEEGKTLEEAYYTQFGAPFQQGGQYRAAALGFYQRNNANPSRLNDYYYEEKKGSYGPQLLEANSYEASHIDNSIPRKEKDTRSFTIPCYINNVCFDNALADLGASGIAEYVLVGTETRLMGETLVLNRSINPSYGDYIELNDLNVPLKLRRDQVDDLMPTIEEGEVIDEPMIDIIKTSNNESFDEYYNFCDFDWKIHIDCAYNLRFSCMIGFEHGNANFFPPLSVNIMSRGFYNSIIKDKVEYKGKNVVGAFMNVPIFVKFFSVVTHFTVVENMDGYRDQDMGDIVRGKPLCKASCVEARRFDGLITIHNGNDNVTYQMA